MKFITLGQLALFFLLIGGLNIAVYRGALWFARQSVRWFSSGKRILGVIALMAALYPFAYFAQAKIRMDNELSVRQAEIAEWPRRPYTRDHGPARLLAPKSAKLDNPKHRLNPAEFVATGVAGQVTNGKEVYVRHKDEGCLEHFLETGRGGLSGAVLARSAFLFCARRAEGIEPGHNVEIFYRLPARRSIRTCGKNFAGASAGVRWSAEKGGGLIAYDELRYHRKMTAFPLLWPKEGLYSHTCAQDREPDGLYREIEYFPLVAGALGYSTLEDFPRQAAVSDLIRALEAANGSQKRNSRLATVLLLGTWPGSPELNDFIASRLNRKPHVSRAFSLALAKKPDPAETGHLPHLRSHVPALLKICRKVGISNTHCKWHHRRAAGLGLLPHD